MAFSNKTKSKLLNKYGTWALVTGASSGIGKALTERLAESGFNILLSARSEIMLSHIATDLESKFNIKTKIIAVDNAHEDGIQKLIETTSTLNIGLVIISAGYGTSGLFIESKINEELNMLHLNCISVFKLTHHFTQKFANQSRGGIILLSSIVAFQGTPYSSHYGATKAYVQSLAEGLYYELKEVHVDILAAAPGPVNTGFAQRAHMQMGNVLKPDDIAIPILKALGKTSTVFPGVLTKLLMFGLRTVPRWGKIRIMKLVMNGMTKHQRISKTKKKT